MLSGNNALILLVHPESFHALAIARSLRSHGLGVVLASSGLEAVSKIRTLPVDLALVDFEMGGGEGSLGSGVEIARGLQVPVLFLVEGDSALKELDDLPGLQVYGCVEKGAGEQLLAAQVSIALRLAEKRAAPLPAARPLSPEMLAVLSAGMRDSDFRAVLNSSIDIETWHAPNGKVLWISPSIERITGFSVADCLAMPDYPLPIIHPDDRPWIADALPNIFSRGSVGNDIEFRLCTSTGGFIWASVSWQPMYDDSGFYMGIHTSVRDINERCQMEEAMQQSEKLYHTVLQLMPDGVSIIGPNGRIQFISERMFQLFGLSRAEEMLGHLATDFIIPEDHLRAQKNIQASMTGQTSGYNAYTMLRPNGQTFIGEIRTSAIPYERSGSSGGFISIVRDVTSRYQAEKELQESRARYQMVFENSGTANAIFDTDCRLTLSNSMFYSHLGGAPSSWLGKTVRELFGDQGEEIEAAMLQVLSTGSSRVYDSQINDPLGTIWLRSALQPLFDADKKVVGVQMISQDITESRQAQEDIRKALHEKEVLLRELYHRTRNNMEVISAMLNLKAAQSSDQSLKQALTDMDSRIRAMALVHQKLYQSQNLSVIDLKDYLGELSALMLKTYQRTEGKVKLTFEAESVPVLIDIAIPCGLIINEILTNSLKYAFPGRRKGEIFVRLSRVGGDRLELQVADNGVGLKPGFDLRDSTGLGTQIIMRIASHQLGAQVAVETRNGVTWRISFRDNRYQARI